MVNINKEFLPDSFDTFKYAIHKNLRTNMIIKESNKFIGITIKIDNIRSSMAKHRRQVW